MSKFGTFQLVGGPHTRGRAADGSRKIFKRGEKIEALSKKEADTWRKWPEKFRELQPGERGEVFVSPADTSQPKPAVTKGEDGGEQVIELTEKDLQAMDVGQLLSLARDNDIEVGTATKKEEIVKIIMNALST